MSLNDRDSDEWLRVCSRQTKRKHKATRSVKRPAIQKPNVPLDYMDDDSLETVLGRFDGIRSSLLLSKPDRTFLEGLLKSINQAFTIISNKQTEPSRIDVICLGLGNPAVHHASLRQLVVLDLLLQFDPRMERSRTHLYDPVFKSVARAIIRKLGMHILPNNKEGCYKLSPDRFYFVMLPHCAPALLNNLLFTNWSPSILSRLVLFSNGWKEARQELIASGASDGLKIAKELAYITALESVVHSPGKEHYLLWSSRNKLREYRDFEGMRVQCFSPVEMDSLPKNVWNIPPYSEKTDKEISCSSKLTQNSGIFSDIIDANVVPNFIDSNTDG